MDAVSLIVFTILFLGMVPLAVEAMENAWSEGGIYLMAIPMCLFVLFMAFSGTVIVIIKIVGLFCGCEA